MYTRKEILFGRISQIDLRSADQGQSRRIPSAYYLHPACHYALELSYDDDLTAAFTRVIERLSRSPLDAADAIDQASINLPT
ncbi:hypothetical protein Taro_002919 [Colocasia esculenta]|uniref:Uncharacterized protein n=1 Tax=Colocasia esculenta TaxID=4460 RepID=A0A843TKM3_COLES|nr:hypothetical protein [Colocasia esculenta]